MSALTRLRNWSRVLTLRIVGTTPTNAQLAGWVGLFDELLSQRAEFDALKRALLDRGVIGEDRYLAALEEMAAANDTILEGWFAGARSTDDGVQCIDPAVWAQTTQGWPA